MTKKQGSITGVCNGGPCIGKVKLPRPENYKKKTLAHLEKLEKKVARYIGYMQDELTKYPNSACAKVWKPMYEHHYQRILLAIAAKTQKMKAA